MTGVPRGSTVEPAWRKKHQVAVSRVAVHATRVAEPEQARARLAPATPRPRPAAVRVPPEHASSSPIAARRMATPVPAGDAVSKALVVAPQAAAVRFAPRRAVPPPTPSRRLLAVFALTLSLGGVGSVVLPRIIMYGSAAQATASGRGSVAGATPARGGVPATVVPASTSRQRHITGPPPRSRSHAHPPSARSMYPSTRHAGTTTKVWPDGVRSAVVEIGGLAQVDPRRIASAGGAPPDRRFGVVQAFTAPAAATYAGVGWERVNFDWRALQPGGPGSWNRAAVSGAMLAQEAAAGREVVGIIIGLPAWATDARGLPRGLYLPATDPHNTWGHFVAELARRYRTRIRHWIVWNEPDVWQPHIAGHTWSGSVADFAQLQRVAYLRLKGIDSGLVVHLAATTYWWDAVVGQRQYLDRLFDELIRGQWAHANHYYFDVASAHIYNVPDDVERILSLYRALMHHHGFGKPIWLNETDVNPTEDGRWSMQSTHHIASVAQQASYAIEAVSLALAAGASRVALYKMTDLTHLSPQAYPIGLLRPDGSARPVLASLRTLTHAFAGFVKVADRGTRGPVRAIEVDRSARGGTLVVWNQTSRPAMATVSLSVPPRSTAAWLAAHVAVVADDDHRLQSRIIVEGGRARLTLALGGSTCPVGQPAYACHIGGPPLLVIAPSMPHLLAATAD